MRRLGYLLPAVAMLVASCSGNGNGVASLDAATADTETGDVESQPTNDEDALLAFAACMREHGIEGFEDPTVDDEGNLQLGSRGGFAAGEIDREAMRAARNACAAHLEDATLGFGRPDDTEIQDQLLAFAACLREQGIDVDDPDLSGSGPDGPAPGRGPLGAIDLDDRDVREALEACQTEFGRGFGPAGPRPGGNGGGEA